MSEKDQVVEILRKAMSPPFKATMGDGAGNVVVAGRPGYVWCRKVGRSEVLMQAYNRGAQTIEGIIVLVQESRTEHLGYEVIGMASGASPDWALKLLSAPPGCLDSRVATRNWPR